MPKSVGFTIIFNGLHHLLHNDYYKTLLESLDYWVIVDGLALPNGSTSWCRHVGNHWHKSGASADGTVEFILSLSEQNKDKIRVILSQGRPWESKDAMVNAAALEARRWVETHSKLPAFLWEIDADEQWTAEDMRKAEREVIEKNGDTGMFMADYFVGYNIVAKGEWGEGTTFPYRRLWVWDGRQYATHEPPMLAGGNGREVLLTQRFKHYAYFYERDVMFKEEFYNYTDLTAKWRMLQKTNDLQTHVSQLISGYWANTNTYLVRQNVH